MTIIELRRQFVDSGLREARAKILSAHRELLNSTSKPTRRKSLERFISQQLKKVELYQEGKLDIDAEIALDILLKEVR